MSNSVGNQFGDMVIGQSIVNVLALSTRPHQSFCTEELQSLRNGRQVVSEDDGHFGNAHFASGQEFQDPEPIGVPKSAKENRGVLATLLFVRRE